MAIKQYYECHITMEGKPDTIKKTVELLGWKFSKIDGDPTLGDGVKCYATRHYNKKYSLDFIIEVVAETSQEINRFCGAEILREKVELVVHDHIFR